MFAALQQAIIWDAADTATPTAVAFRKVIHLQGKPDSATLQVFADARYTLWINGVMVAGGPNRFDPKRPEVDTLQVGPHLAAGPNTLAVLVYGRLSNYRFIRHQPGLGCLLEARTGGRTERHLTDATWRTSAATRFGPPEVLISGLADRVDERREAGDWTAPGFDDTAWPNAVAVPGDRWGAFQPRAIPLLTQDRIEGGRLVAIVRKDATEALDRPIDAALPLELGPDEAVTLDLGKMCRASLEAGFEPRGEAEVEMLPRQCTSGRDAAFMGSSRYVAADRPGRRTYRTTDETTCRLVTFRVLRGRVTLYGLGAVERRYPFQRVGSFHSSDEFLNRLWGMAVRTAEVNAVDGYIDGSEGGEWVTGHIDYPVTEVAFAADDGTGRPLTSDMRLLANQLSRMSLSQEGDNLLRAWHPTDWNLGPRDMERGIHNFIEDSSCCWVNLLRQVYEGTGDRALVDRLWPVTERLVAWFLARRTERGLVRAREFYLHFDNPIAFHECEGATLNAMVYSMLRDAASLAASTGRRSQAARWGRAARDLAAAFNRHLWDAEKGAYLAGLKEGEKRLLTRWPDASFDRYFAAIDQSIPAFPPTPQATVMALVKGLVPPDRLAMVRRTLMERHNEFLSPVSYLFAFEAMYEMDTDAADLEALQTMRRRWATMVGRSMPGTLGEQFGDESYYCHDFGPIPAAFLSARVLGVRRVGPLSRKRLLIEPRLADLREASGVVCTRHGPVAVAWERTLSGGLRFKVSVPEGVTAELALPMPAEGAALTLDGKPRRAPTRRGRFATLNLRGGDHSGSMEP
jgi:hypothetical protein